MNSATFFLSTKNEQIKEEQHRYFICIYRQQSNYHSHSIKKTFVQGYGEGFKSGNCIPCDSNMQAKLPERRGGAGCGGWHTQLSTQAQRRKENSHTCIVESSPSSWRKIAHGNVVHVYGRGMSHLGFTIAKWRWLIQSQSSLEKRVDSMPTCQMETPSKEIFNYLSRAPHRVRESISHA